MNWSWPCAKPRRRQHPPGMLRKAYGAVLLLGDEVPSMQAHCVARHRSVDEKEGHQKQGPILWHPHPWMRTPPLLLLMSPACPIHPQPPQGEEGRGLIGILFFPFYLTLSFLLSILPALISFSSCLHKRQNSNANNQVAEDRRILRQLCSELRSCFVLQATTVAVIMATM